MCRLESGPRNFDVIMNLSFIFLFGRISVRGKFIIPSGFSSDLFPKVLCLCNLLPDYVSHSLSPRLSQTMRCAIGGPRAPSDLMSLCAGWNSIVPHIDAPVCMCIIMSAHPLQSWVLCASSSAGRFWQRSPKKRFLKPKSTYQVLISL